MKYTVKSGDADRPEYIEGRFEHLSRATEFAVLMSTKFDVTLTTADGLTEYWTNGRRGLLYCDLHQEEQKATAAKRK